MIVGSTILCVVALQEVGGLSGLHSTLKSFDPDMVNIWPSSLKFGATLWLAAFFLGGLGIAGQPQVVSRVMTLKDDKARKEAAVWFFVWQTPFIILMFFIGLTCRAIFLDMDASDAETGLPVLAMAVLSPFLAGVILASIFAATMSTADSQVLACTAAITDDIRPQWSQDHSTTKKVTLGVAVFATVLSIVGQQFPGFGDSVFALVVLAVYGLGGIFVPLLLIRMMGYEPDTNHTIAMMIAAMSGVILWIITGFGTDIFPSVPGMGAAFAVHFIMCNFREQSSSNPFGRYSLPARKTMTIAGVVVLVLTASVEASYYAFAPDSIDTSGPAPDSMWNLTVEFAYVYEEQVVQIGDGETQTFSFDIPSDAMGVSFGLNYSESNEGGILQQCDDVNSVFDDSGIPSQFANSNLVNLSGQNCGENNLGGFSTWGGFVEIDTHVNQMSALANLTIVKGEGEILFDVRVDVNRGTPVNGDSGEDITIVMMYHTVESWTLSEVE
jgi:MFS family permease